jgi:integrase/recombinase XerC
MTYKESFFQYLQIEKRYSHHTVRSYTNDLDQFFIFLQSMSLPENPQEITSRDIRAWIVSMLEKGYTAVSVHRKISCLRVYFRYLRKEGYVNNDPLQKVSLPRRKKQLPVFVEELAMDTVVDADPFGNDFTGLMNRTIIEMFYVTGMRRSELTGLRVGDIDLAEATVKVTGKRNKQRIIPLLGTFIPQLKEYLRQRADFVNDREVEWFFITGRCNKLYDKYVYTIVKRYLSMVTTIDKKSPHVLRHTFATHMLNHGADLNSIKELLGHANLAATQVYTHNTFEKLKKIYKQAHPRA